MVIILSLRIEIKSETTSFESVRVAQFVKSFLERQAENLGQGLALLFIILLLQGESNVLEDIKEHLRKLFRLVLTIVAVLYRLCLIRHQLKAIMEDLGHLGCAL